MRPTTLSIIIGTYNRFQLLQKCIMALDNGLHVDYEIVVMDAGSTDGTLEYLNGLPKVRVVRDLGLIGQAQSFNHVLNIVEGKYLCWLSDDNMIQEGMLDLAISILENNPMIGMVALKVKDVTGPYVDAPYLGGVWESGILNCNQGLLPTSLLRSLGGFDEEFRDYGIDADLTTRVLLAGFQVVYTKQVAIHHYRNHEDDNWVAGDERKNRLERARVLYSQKYARLIEGSASYLASAWVDFRLLKYCAGFLGLFAGIFRSRILKQWERAYRRDLSNIATGRFISRWDLIRCIYHPYYLVQEIPKTLLKEYQNINDRSKVMTQ